MVFFALALSSGGGSFGFVFPGLFFLFFLVVVVIMIANAAMQGGSRIQRPHTEQTAFPPPPPPDTTLVKCDYCRTSQTFKERCENCGAPLPKPGFY
jgi:predicted RNA-binding Zn-ribbon protein involved in translation (DUF1610 family)